MLHASDPRARSRGFSLLELAVALAIAGLVTTAALSATVMLQKSLGSTRKTTELSDDARFTLEHLLAPLRTAGGGAVRPWQAISTTCRDDPRFPLPACTTAPPREVKNRLHVVELEGSGQCSIDRLAGGRVFVATGGGACCLADPAAYGALLNPVVLFPRDDAGTRSTFQGATWRARMCKNINTADCSCVLDDTKPGFDAPPPAGTVTDAAFAGGVMARGSVTSYYVAPSGHLMALFDVTGAGTALSTEFTPRVISFDTRLGYDSAPVDGILDGLRATPDAGNLADLRLVRVGLALAARVPDDRPAVSSMFGVPIDPPGKRAVVVEGNATLRAVGVFQ